MGSEEFVPVTHSAPDSFLNRLKFCGRLMADFQVLSVYRHLRRHRKLLHGRIVDVGCGESPYRHLVSTTTQENYVGVDIQDAVSFGYDRKDVVTFDGENLPFADDSFDSCLCTEVLEHVPEPTRLVDEMFRVMRKGGWIFVTVPWSARTHYMPHDYQRFTPTKLALMFKKFDSVQILPRGNDVNTICAKIIVVYLRQVVSLAKHFNALTLLRLIPVTVGLPLVMVTVGIGHLALALRLGSEADPLGYTIVARKP